MIKRFADVVVDPSTIRYVSLDGRRVRDGSMTSEMAVILTGGGEATVKISNTSAKALIDYFDEQASKSDENQVRLENVTPIVDEDGQVGARVYTTIKDEGEADKDIGIPDLVAAVEIVVPKKKGRMRPRLVVEKQDGTRITFELTDDVAQSLRMHSKVCEGMRNDDPQGSDFEKATRQSCNKVGFWMDERKPPTATSEAASCAIDQQCSQNPQNEATEGVYGHAFRGSWPTLISVDNRLLRAEASITEMLARLQGLESKAESQLGINELLGELANSLSPRIAVMEEKHSQLETTTAWVKNLIDRVTDLEAGSCQTTMVDVLAKDMGHLQENDAKRASQWGTLYEQSRKIDQSLRSHKAQLDALIHELKSRLARLEHEEKTVHAGTPVYLADGQEGVAKPSPSIDIDEGSLETPEWAYLVYGPDGIKCRMRRVEETPVRSESGELLFKKVVIQCERDPIITKY